LAWGTKKENQRDRKNNGTSMEGEKSPLAKLTTQQVRQIIYIYRTGLFTMKEIANQFQMNWTTIRNIINRKLWKHVWIGIN
jgi:DNA-binding MarR family transcriptional regulator